MPPSSKARNPSFQAKLDRSVEQVRQFVRRWARQLVLLEDLPPGSSLLNVAEHLGSAPAEAATFVAENGRAAGRWHRDRRPEEDKALGALARRYPLPEDYRAFLEKFGSLTVLHRRGQGSLPGGFYLRRGEELPRGERGLAILHVMDAVEVLDFLREGRRARLPVIAEHVGQLKTVCVELEPGGGLEAPVWLDLEGKAELLEDAAGFANYFENAVTLTLQACEEVLARSSVPSDDAKARAIVEGFAQAPAKKAPKAAGARRGRAGSGPAMVDEAVAQLREAARRDDSVALLEDLEASAVEARLGLRFGGTFKKQHADALGRFRKAAPTKAADLRRLEKLAGRPLPPGYRHFLERYGSLTLLGARHDGAFPPGNLSGTGSAWTQVLAAPRAAEVTGYIRNLVEELPAAADLSADHLLVFHGGWMHRGYALDLGSPRKDGECPVQLISDDAVGEYASSGGRPAKAVRVAGSFGEWLQAEVAQLLARLPA